MGQRRLIGVTWDELPAFGLSTTEHLSAAYPQGEPFDELHITKWLNEVQLKKTMEGEARSRDFASKADDTTLTDYFLGNVELIDRE